MVNQFRPIYYFFCFSSVQIQTILPGSAGFRQRSAGAGRPGRRPYSSRDVSSGPTRRRLLCPLRRRIKRESSPIRVYANHTAIRFENSSQICPFFTGCPSEKNRLPWIWEPAQKPLYCVCPRVKRAISARLTARRQSGPPRRLASSPGTIARKRGSAPLSATPLSIHPAGMWAKW